MKNKNKLSRKIILQERLELLGKTKKYLLEKSGEIHQQLYGKSRHDRQMSLEDSLLFIPGVEQQEAIKDSIKELTIIISEFYGELQSLSKSKSKK